MKKKFATEKTYKRWRRHKRVRNRVVGTAERPRVCVYRSNVHIYAQLIDDTAGATLVSVSSLKVAAPAAAKPAAKAKAKKAPPKAEEAAAEGAKESAREAALGGRKTALAREVGRMLAEAAKSKGFNKVCFDRGGYLYHGRVAALAESAREHGLEF